MIDEGTGAALMLDFADDRETAAARRDRLAAYLRDRAQAPTGVRTAQRAGVARLYAAIDALPDGARMPGLCPHGQRVACGACRAAR